MSRSAGKVVWVAGVGRGIGRAIVVAAPDSKGITGQVVSLDGGYGV